MSLRQKVTKRYTVLAEDEETVVYHVTYANRLEGIAKRGLRRNSPRSIGAPAYDSHAKGRLFFTNFDGISFWMHRAEDFAEHSSDHPLTDLYVPVVLRTTVDTEDLQEDKEGTRDAGSNAWFVQHDSLLIAAPLDIEVWDGSKWSNVSDADLDYESAFDVDVDPDGGDDIEWFKTESPFLPKAP